MEKSEATKLIIIGGGEDKRADKEILREIVERSGSDQAHIAVVTTATTYPLEVGEEYKQLFYDLGAKKVETINILSRQEANRREIIKSIQGMDCIFFVGGDQLRISSLLGGTDFHYAVHRFMEEGGIIAGTSAGASMMSEVMVVEGDEEEAPKKSAVRLAPGMGFLKGVIIDQHFNQRGRMGRLLGAVAQNPYPLGLGIDENTAMVIDREHRMMVIGSGVVTVVDGGSIEFTNISEQYPDEPLVITNVKVHILPSEYGFHLTKRKAILKDELRPAKG